MQVGSGTSILGHQPAKAASSTSGTKTPAANDGGIAQASEDSASKKSSVEADFLKYAKMTPFAGILKSMNLTEDDLAKMSPDQRKAVEEKIRDAIEKQLEKQGQKTGSLVDLSA